MIKDYIKALSANKMKLIAYIVVCIITVLMLTVFPVYMWINSDAEIRGVALVRGDSMAPTVVDNSVLFVQPTKFERGEIVVAKSTRSDNYTTANGMALLKRIVGLPGETIEIVEEGVLINGKLLDESAYINVQNESLLASNKINEIVLSDDEYFILGDNRSDSFDSRHVGAIHATNFMYGLTNEPNEHTYGIIKNVIAIAIVNLILLIAMPILFLVVLSVKRPLRNNTKKNTN